MKCSKCGLEGYLFEEKKRPSYSKPREVRYRVNWNIMKREPFKYKTYVGRPKHRYASFVHNIKRDGKWTIKKCYLGVIPEKKCNCEICNTHTDLIQ